MQSCGSLKAEASKKSDADIENKGFTKSDIENKGVIQFTIENTGLMAPVIHLRFMAAPKMQKAQPGGCALPFLYKFRIAKPGKFKCILLQLYSVWNQQLGN